MADLDYKEEVDRKIEATIKDLPEDWATRAGKKMDKKPRSIEAIRLGYRGNTLAKRAKLLEVLLEIKSEYEEELKDLLAR